MRPSTMLTILPVLLLFSCSKSDDTTPKVSLPDSDGWVITTYLEDQVDHTSTFFGYVFAFTKTGSILATHQGQTFNGTWVSGVDDSTPKLILSFSTTPLTELNEDWEVLEQTAILLRLRHVSGGNGSVDDLTFQRT